MNGLKKPVGKTQLFDARSKHFRFTPSALGRQAGDAGPRVS